MRTPKRSCYPNSANRVPRSLFAGLLIPLFGAALLGAAVLLLAWPQEAQARRGGGRSYAAAAQARKQRMIASIQQQLVVARQVLESAEKQTAMSQAEVSAAISKLSGLREELKTARQEEIEAGKSLREIEAKILGEQASGSDWDKARTAVSTAKADVHRTIQEILKLPEIKAKSSDAAVLEDLAALTPAQREMLNKDSTYQAAKELMKEAERKADQVRQKLFRANEDWAAATKDRVDADRKERVGGQQAQATGMGSLGDRQTLREAKSVAASARYMVAEGEARLRQLGVKPAAPAKTSKSSSGSTK